MTRPDGRHRNVGGFALTLRATAPRHLLTEYKGFKGVEVALMNTFVDNDDPVLLLEMSNRTEGDLEYVQTNIQGDFRVDAYGPLDRRIGPGYEGATPPPAPLTALATQLYTPPQPGGYPLSGGLVTVPAGQTKAYRLYPAVLYDLTIPGVYAVSVRHRFPVRSREVSDEESWSRAITLTRGPHWRTEPDVLEEAVSNTLYLLMGRQPILLAASE